MSIPKMSPGVVKAVADLLRLVIEKASRAYGFIHRAEIVTINGKHGYLIWDWIIANEITFLPNDQGEIVSLLVSMDDAATARRFDELVAEYGRQAKSPGQ